MLSSHEQFDAGIFSVDAAALGDERCGLELTGISRDRPEQGQTCVAVSEDKQRGLEPSGIPSDRPE